MANQRPPLHLVKARQWEIKRRYERQAKVGKRTKSMAAIRLAELTRWLDNWNGAGVELEPCDESVQVARIFAHHIAGLSDSARRISSWLDRYAPWISPRDHEYLITEATSKPLHWSADKLAWRIRLTDAKRTELKITTIGAIDCTKEQRAARRKEQRAKLMRELRAKRKANSVNTI